MQAFKETELPIHDNFKRRRFAATATNNQAIISVCNHFTTIVKKDFDKNKINLVLKVLEIFTQNEESVNVGVLQGKI